MDKQYDERGRFEVYVTGPNVLGIIRHLTEVAEGYRKDGNRLSSMITSFNTDPFKPEIVIPKKENK